MHAAHGREFDTGEGGANFYTRLPERGAQEWQPSRYGARAPHLPTILAIAVAHVALLALLVTFDVIPLRRPVSTPLVVELLPDIAPPPEVTPARPIDPPAVAPSPLVRVETVAPPPLVSVETPPPVVAAPTAAAAPPSPAPAAEAPPAPVTPPDFSAGYLNNPAPKYPLDARRAKEQGTVRIKVLVDADGGIDQIKLASSSGSGRLDDAAMDAVRRWRFAPARQAGKPVSAWVIVPIPFQLRA